VTKPINYFLVQRVCTNLNMSPSRSKRSNLVSPQQRILQSYGTVVGGYRAIRELRDEVLTPWLRSGTGTTHFNDAFWLAVGRLQHSELHIEGFVAANTRDWLHIVGYAMLLERIRQTVRGFDIVINSNYQALDGTGAMLKHANDIREMFLNRHLNHTLFDLRNAVLQITSPGYHEAVTDAAVGMMAWEMYMPSTIRGDFMRVVGQHTMPQTVQELIQSTGRRVLLIYNTMGVTHPEYNGAFGPQQNPPKGPQVMDRGKRGDDKRDGGDGGPSGSSAGKQPVYGAAS